MKIKSGITKKKILDTVMLVGSEPGSDFTGSLALNETAEFIFDKLAAGIERAELIKALCGEYEISPEQAEKDTDAVIAQFEKYGIL